MTIQKTTSVDRIEVVASGCVQVRTRIDFLENDAVVNSFFHRHVIAPGDNYSAEDARVQAICVATHTDDVVAAYRTKLAEHQNTTA